LRVRKGGGKCNKLDPKVGKAILPTHILVLVDSVMKGGGVRSVRSKNPYFALIHFEQGGDASSYMLLPSSFFISFVVSTCTHGLG
jgi:hypothetical protein